MFRKLWIALLLTSSASASTLTVATGRVSFTATEPGITALGVRVTCGAAVNCALGSPWQGMAEGGTCTTHYVFAYDPSGTTWPVGVDTPLFIVDGCPALAVVFGAQASVVYQCTPVSVQEQTWTATKQLYR